MVHGLDPMGRAIDFDEQCGLDHHFAPGHVIEHRNRSSTTGDVADFQDAILQARRERILNALYLEGMSRRYQNVKTAVTQNNRCDPFTNPGRQKGSGHMDAGRLLHIPFSRQTWLGQEHIDEALMRPSADLRKAPALGSKPKTGTLTLLLLETGQCLTEVNGRSHQKPPVFRPQTMSSADFSITPGSVVLVERNGVVVICSHIGSR
ncbi:uncharacterized protein Z518_07181 [Rhinocladiella mackenziei CBS 650.93]|uniref:Uncharacterized protein n=1 Tax=Rhinocladiella mackenziei CBS 650.93 TaxID=1442369 RepID=A0A0D2GZK7_9EURO|nr:uncharacterized protein Z518_07181 [Rhinocladiella mackenziei CBS 650.93]KIX03628.1 hypothetical protein Z518_07181 [Rhinocladiella mackenziei CBS 650.93]